MSEVANDKRAEWAMAAVNAFPAKDGNELHVVLGDLLADIMHLCRKEDIDFGDVVLIGKMHFDAEVNGDD